MYDNILLHQPEMYVYTQEGMYVTQIQLTWKISGADTMAHGIFYVCNNDFIDTQIKLIKQMFVVILNEAERLADFPFKALL